MSLKRKMASYFRCFLTLISPELNTKVTYRVKFGKKLDLNKPKTFNEKCLWLKLNTYNNNPLVIQCADKYAVREYIKDKGEESILNGLIGCYEDPKDIPWDTLPDKFAIKMNTGCGHNIIVSDKSKLDVPNACKTLLKWKKDKKSYLSYSEMQYKYPKPLILIEEYLGDEDGNMPNDYKFFCMNGVCRAIVFCTDRVIGGPVNVYLMDRDWNILPYDGREANDPNIKIKKPENLNQAIMLAEKLSEDFPQVRVDFYIDDSKIIFGELTFTTAGAMWTDLCEIFPGTSKSVDEVFGEYLTIPTDKC